jgi:hypothetical protein
MAIETHEPDQEERPPAFWNVRWVLSLLGLLLAIGAAIGEYLGWFRDVGLVLGLAGIAITVWLGLTAVPQSTADLMRFDLRGVRRDLGRGLGETNRRLEDRVASSRSSAEVLTSGRGRPRQLRRPVLAVERATR